MSKKEQPFDAAAFMAAVQAATSPAPRPVSLPGIGDAFMREATVADVHEASEIASKHADELGVPLKRVTVGVGLAQTICGPDGARVFDPENIEHVKSLCALPWGAVRGLMSGGGAEDAKNG